ncbi:MAG: hypothetical protein P8P74_15860 [Crocinitomicaceae bacterium]|nr:hypothetical protein [Crocinitomicaceae bacterium]
MGNKFKLEFEDGTTETVTAEIKPPKDIIQFVAGTTDPVNTHGLKNQANKDYWRGVDNLWANVQDLKPQYLDLHIEDTFFSWSGDNSTEERTKGAKKLMDTLLRVYSNWTKKEVHLHLIGHSHGGNVINQFTNEIVDSSDFPENWAIKSITYLSTPFFKDQHQLNHSKMHADAKIINVHNDYDITQRFVADFTMKNLEGLIGNFVEFNKLKAAVDQIIAIDKSAYGDAGIVVNNHTEGPAMWTTTRDLLVQGEIVMDVIQKNLAFIGARKKVSPQKQEFLDIINDIHQLLIQRIAVFNTGLTDRDGGYGWTELWDDLRIYDLMPLVNRIMAIDDGESDSFILGFLENVFMEEDNGLVAKIDDTSTSPENQVNGAFPIEDFDITDLDPYDKNGKKSDFEKFATGVEDAQKDGKLKEILMRMISQFIDPADVQAIVDGINKAEWIMMGDWDDQLKELRGNIEVYQGLVSEYNMDLVTEADKNNEELEIKPGSIPYLAMTSHSLSHTDLFDDDKHNVKEALTGAFSSGENPGYQQ